MAPAHRAQHAGERAAAGMAGGGSGWVGGSEGSRRLVASPAKCITAGPQLTQAATPGCTSPCALTPLRVNPKSMCGVQLYDETRIDHFRAFAGYWAVAADAETGGLPRSRATTCTPLPLRWAQWLQFSVRPARHSGISRWIELAIPECACANHCAG